MGRTALAVGAHPDDIEFVMAGTLIRFKDAGYDVHYWHIANGSCGSAELPAEAIARIRLEEAQAAASVIGAVFHAPWVNDFEIFYEQALLAKVSALVREIAPDVLLTHAPSDYMEDHQNAGRLAATAVFCRGIPNFPTDPPCAPVDGEVTVYHALPHGSRGPLGEPVHPSHFVDVGGDVLARKVKMLACHQSQKAWLDRTQGMDSYVQAMEDNARQVGALSGRFAYAEGWRRRLHLGFCGEAVDPLVHDLPVEFVSQP